jgi:TetR/AcrR family fatty acid metabolism transcriptional regulator
MSRTQTKREKLAEKEEAILRAATKAFLEGGLKAARMAEIAAAAKVAEGTIYLYYRSKQALFEAVVARHWDDLRKGAEQAVRSSTEPADQLRALARYTLGRVMGERKLFELTLFLAHGGGGEEASATDRQGYVRVFDQVVERGRAEGAFSPTTDTKVLRDLFFGTIDYAARSALARGCEEPPPETVSMLMRAMSALLEPAAAAQESRLAERIERAVERLEAAAARYPAG